MRFRCHIPLTLRCVFFHSGLPITLTLGFCIATFAILFMDTEESCSRVGVLKRLPDDELTTPEEFLANRLPLLSADEEHDLILIDEEQGDMGKETTREEEHPSESTPLIA